ncbi:MAG: hypothetical protein JST48_12970 [Bacteroidetes bacterium]|nr:hypothetical protein [Bacteroidota bacterium]
MKRLLFLLSFSFCATGCFAQKIIKSFKPGKIESVSVDRLGNFFLLLADGSIKKYDRDGKSSAQIKNINPSLIEPWFYPRIFVYRRVEQKYLVYDPKFSLLEQIKIDPAVAITPYLACPTNDGKVLVLDRADWSVKKISPVTNQVLSEFTIDSARFNSSSDIIQFQEYQNMIFLLDKTTGIYFLNNLGQQVNFIEGPINNFGFFGEELYYLQHGQIIFYDLFSEKSRQLKLEEGKFVIVTDERIVLVRPDNKVIIFDYQPKAE